MSRQFMTRLEKLDDPNNLEKKVLISFWNLQESKSLNIE